MAENSIKDLLEELLSRAREKDISNGDAEIIARAITSRLKPFFDNVILRTAQKTGSTDVLKELQELRSSLSDKLDKLYVESVKKKDTIYLLANLLALLANIILLIVHWWPK